MPIHQPGQKFRHSRVLNKGTAKRSVVALLSLTAMVDMFTVLVIFLLQNYNVSEFIVYTPKELALPAAEKIKELKPAVIVTVSSKEVLIGKSPIVSTSSLSKTEDWMIQPLFAKVVEAISQAHEDYEKDLKSQIKKVVDNAKGEGKRSEDKEMTPWSKVTIQADKGIDFLTLKKVMYTVTEAGASEINFAVTKDIHSGTK